MNDSRLLTLRIIHVYMSGFNRTWEVAMSVDLVTGNICQAGDDEALMVASESDRAQLAALPAGTIGTLEVQLSGLYAVLPDEMVEHFFNLLREYRGKENDKRISNIRKRPYIIL